MTTISIIQVFNLGNHRITHLLQKNQQLENLYLARILQTVFIKELQFVLLLLRIFTILIDID